MYLQTVRGYSPILSGAIILPMVASHGVGSLVSGHIISKTGHYGPLRANDHLFELCLVGGCVVAVDLHEDKSCVGDLFDWVFAGDWDWGAFQRASIQTTKNQDRLWMILTSNHSWIGCPTSTLQKSRSSSHKLSAEFSAYPRWLRRLD